MNNSNVINNKYDFMMIFDVKNGNPNGDPNMDNEPRQIPDTGKGLVSDCCIKHMIRNYVNICRDVDSDYSENYEIFMNTDNLLNFKIGDVIDEYTTKKSDKESNKKSGELTVEEVGSKDEIINKDGTIINKKKALNAMCNKYWDIRTFGAVINTGKGKDVFGDGITGPVQICMAESVDVINPLYIKLTRQAITSSTPEDVKNWKGGYGTMANKYIVPYGLYVTTGHVSPKLAQKYNFTEKDLELLWDSIANMFEFDRSASRGEMTLRRLIIFKHNSAKGNCLASRLFDSVDIHKKDGVEVPESFKDYVINIDNTKIPDTVTVIEM